MAAVTLHLRSETKPLEHRSALSPSVIRKLIEHGFGINIERSPERIFDDAEYKSLPGVTMVEEGSWPRAPRDHIIIGLKELEDKNPFPLVHTHISFMHCFKDQGGWQDVLGRFPRGGGKLYDLEFLEENKRRVAAFGYHAGYAGAALALLDWAWQLEHGGDVPLPGRSHYQNKDNLDNEVKAEVLKGERKAGKLPTVLITGALGRCGRGSFDLLRICGIPEANIIRWDLDEFKKIERPYVQAKEADIFINCIYLGEKIDPKFLELPFLQEGTRNLSVICDVSCDTTNPNNPIPFCNESTYFNKPTISLPGFSPPLSYITIDHLPSLLPREASEAFSEALLPSLLQLPDRNNAPVWVGAEELFKQKVKLLPDHLKQRETQSLNGAT